MELRPLTEIDANLARAEREGDVTTWVRNMRIKSHKFPDSVPNPIPVSEAFHESLVVETARCNERLGGYMSCDYGIKFWVTPIVPVVELQPAGA